MTERKSNTSLEAPGRRKFVRATCAAAVFSAFEGPTVFAAAADGPAAGSPSVLPGAFETRIVEVDGLPMHTVVSADSPPGAPALVLVHGLALSGRYMMPVARELARDFRVYVPDFPGFGDSGKPDRILDVPGLSDWLVAWMKAAGLDSAMMLGNSFGCQIIVDVAARYPSRVTRAVLQGPTTPPDERTWIRQFVRWRQNSPYNPPEMGEIANADYRKCGLLRALLTFEFSLRDRIEDKLPLVPQPMLVVRGGEDPICRQDWAEEVVRRLPDGRLVVIPDVAHTLVYTSGPALAEASRPFLGESARI